MRIRQVKPAYFKDARIAALPPAVRLFYIGLWMLCDDAGYFRWDASEAGLELYGYESRRKRERDVNVFLAALVEAGRVERFPDCDHIYVPHLTDHQRFGGPGKRHLVYQVEHSRCSPRMPADARESPQSPATVRIGTEQVTVDGTVRKGTVRGRGRETEAPAPATEFQQRVPRP